MDQLYFQSQPPTYPTVNDQLILAFHNAARNFDQNELINLLGIDQRLASCTLSNTGRTPTHSVLENKFKGSLQQDAVLECLKILHESNADFNVADFQGQTPLHLAIDNGFEECAEALIFTYECKYGLNEATKISEEMPELLIKVLDSGVTYENDIVCLDWRPVVQLGTNNKKLPRYAIQRETQFLYNLINTKKTDNRTRYLTHPLVQAFVYRKDQARLNNFRNLTIVAMIFPILYVSYVLQLYFQHCKFRQRSPAANGNQTSSTSTTAIPNNEWFFTEVNCSLNFTITLLSYLIEGIFAIWLLIQIFKFLRSPDRKFFLDYSTWIFRLTMISVAITAFPALRITEDNSSTIAYFYPIASISIFLASLMFLIQLGGLFFAPYLEMLYQITRKVIAITIMFLPLCGGFFMGFNLMFDDVTIFRFIVMTIDTGSVDFSTLIDDTQEKNYLFESLSYVICVAFLILIIIVFLNFLTSISIDNVNRLRHHAKVAQTVNRIYHHFIVDLSNRNCIVSENNWYYKYSPDATGQEQEVLLSEEIKSNILSLVKRKQLQEQESQLTEGLREKLGGKYSNPSDELLAALLTHLEKLESEPQNLTQNYQPEDESYQPAIIV